MDRVSALLDQAQAAKSLDNFGDESFREGLGRLVASADAEARFNDAGSFMFDAQIVSFLSSRLQIEHWYRLHPEIEEEEIVAPLIGLGLPRTGSTDTPPQSLPPLYPGYSTLCRPTLGGV